MSYFFHPEAEKEFLEAIDYYEEREAGLGFDFAVEVYAAIGRAVEHPKSWPIIDGEGEDARRNDFHTACCIRKKQMAYSLLP